MSETIRATPVPSGRLKRFRWKFVDVVSLRRWARARSLRSERRAADDDIVRSNWVSPLLAWRANEIVARKNRVALARSIRTAMQYADGRYLPNASPVNRQAVRTESRRLLALASRLEGDDPVAPRGVLLVERLLSDNSGPLYSRERADAFPTYLDVALAALNA
jgi:hypothetical protein